MPQTNRLEDANGWFEVKNNPISKAGIFDYLGSEIDAPEPNRIYKVLRSPEELGSPETLDSIRLLPWIDDHVPLLGKEENGFVPAEQKGVQGTTGEDVTFDGEVLYSNIKVFSEAMSNSIEQGKIELSLGYRCQFSMESGIFNGQQYEAVQRNIRGNHLALVKDGRMGKDVAVLDHANEFIITLDSKEIVKMADPTDMTKANDADPAAEAGSDPTLAEVLALFKTLAPQIAELQAAFAAMAPAAAAAKEPDGDEPAMDSDPASGDVPADQVKAIGDSVAALKAQVQELENNGVKAIMKTIAARDSLYNKVSPIMGAFDHSLMTAQEIAEKAVAHESIALTCDKGSELATLNGFLASYQGNMTTFAIGDSNFAKPASNSEVDSYLKPQVK